MRKALRIIFPFIILGVLLYLFLGIRKQLNQQTQVHEYTAYLPQENYFELDSTVATIKNQKGHYVYILFFNSGCEYCQEEIRLLNKNQGAFDKATVYLLSTESLAEIKAFKEEYLTKNTRFIMGKMDMVLASEEFGLKNFPYTLIYDENNKLVSTYKGLVKLEALTQYLKDE